LLSISDACQLVTATPPGTFFLLSVWARNYKETSITLRHCESARAFAVPQRPRIESACAFAAPQRPRSQGKTTKKQQSNGVFFSS